ncbi:BrxA family protein [Tomitella gaofuii]|uniref:BrxA family protein n=1 Tax=Tomitella gaofuii TaxID=2760083 RepID=UPI0015F9CEC1
MIAPSHQGHVSTRDANAPYRLSFTTGGLLRSPATAIAAMLIASADASTVRTDAVEWNIVQQRSAASTVRVTREVMQRLAELPQPGLELVADGSVDGDAARPRRRPSVAGAAGTAPPADAGCRLPVRARGCHPAGDRGAVGDAHAVPQQGHQQGHSRRQRQQPQNYRQHRVRRPPAMRGVHR